MEMWNWVGEFLSYNTKFDAKQKKSLGLVVDSRKNTKETLKKLQDRVRGSHPYELHVRSLMNR